MLDYTNKIVRLFSKNRHETVANHKVSVSKEEFQFLGISDQEIKELAKIAFRTIKTPKYNDCKAIVRELFSLGEREYMYFATLLFNRIKKNWQITDIIFIESLLEIRPGWDSVTRIQKNLIHQFFEKFPAAKKDFIRAWNESPYKWQNVAALISQAHTKDVDLELVEECVNAHKNSKDPIIQKAIGAALRESSKVNPEWALKFIVYANLKKATKEVAIRWLDNKKFID